MNSVPWRLLYSSAFIWENKTQTDVVAKPMFLKQTNKQNDFILGPSRSPTHCSKLSRFLTSWQKKCVSSPLQGLSIICCRAWSGIPQTQGILSQLLAGLWRGSPPPPGGHAQPRAPSVTATPPLAILRSRGCLGPRRGPSLGACGGLRADVSAVSLCRCEQDGDGGRLGGDPAAGGWLPAGAVCGGRAEVLVPSVLEPA